MQQNGSRISEHEALQYLEDGLHPAVAPELNYRLELAPVEGDQLMELQEECLRARHEASYDAEDGEVVGAGVGGKHHLLEHGDDGEQQRARQAEHVAY